MIGVTTFSQSIYDRYGWKLLESAAKYWPGKLIAYVEAREPTIRADNIEYRKLFDIPGIVPFLQHIQNIPLALGKTPKGYNYNYDAWKFSRKAFCQWQTCFEYPAKKVFWLDADIEMRKDIPESTLVDWFHGKPYVYLGRNGFYTETGFLGFDSAQCQALMEKYRDCYQRGILFTLPRWHDCEAFDWARGELGIEGHNLSPFYEDDPEELDVFPRTELAEYLLHDKGPTKDRAQTGT